MMLPFIDLVVISKLLVRKIHISN